MFLFRPDKAFSAFEGCGSNLAAFWSAYVKYCNRKRKVTGVIDKTGSVTTSDLGAAEALADQFDSVWASNFHKPPCMVPQLFSAEEHCDFAFVECELLRLSPTKACGFDDIPAIFLKNCATILAPFICAVINRSLAESKLPDQWKFAIFSLCRNFRVPKM